MSSSIFSGSFIFLDLFKSCVQRWKISQPHGGVRKGNTFRGQTQAKIQDERNAIRIPVGGWKDSLLDFCTLGPLHPSFCMGFFCPLSKCQWICFPFSKLLPTFYGNDCFLFNMLSFSGFLCLRTYYQPNLRTLCYSSFRCALRYHWIVNFAHLYSF